MAQPVERVPGVGSAQVRVPIDPFPRVEQKQARTHVGCAESVTDRPSAVCGGTMIANRAGLGWTGRCPTIIGISRPWLSDLPTQRPVVADGIQT